MIGKSINIVVIVCLLASAQFCQALADGKVDSTKNDYALQVYLLREITIEDDTIRLGQVSIIRGKESLVSKASKVALGRFSEPDQRIVVDRLLVLSRLACSQIPASKVTLTGAEKITVKRQQQVIKGEEFVEQASSFLGENPPNDSVCQWKPIRTPKDLAILGVGKDIKFSLHLARSSARNQAKVQVAVFAGGEEIGSRDVSFRLKYHCRTAVAQVDIPAGALINAENVKIEKRQSNYPEPADWSPPYGLIAKRRVAANTVIRPEMVGSVKPVVIIKRYQNVIIRLEKPGLLVTAIGKAMQKACTGEYIKVQNVDSQRIILAKVNEDGTVEPVF